MPIPSSRTCLLAGVVVVLLLAPGCRRTAKSAATPTQAKADTVIPLDLVQPVHRQKRRRLPPPLRPRAPEPQLGAEQDASPCSMLVTKVCSLLSERAEECTEARRRVWNRPGTIRQERCEEALEWYRIKIDEARRPRPCQLLAAQKCENHGEGSAACINARADVEHLASKRHHMCRAELLLYHGLR